MKEESLRSFVEGKEYENDNLNNRADNAKIYQGALLIIQEFEKIIKRQKRNRVLHRVKGANIKDSKALMNCWIW